MAIKGSGGGYTVSAGAWPRPGEAIRASRSILAPPGARPPSAGPSTASRSPVRCSGGQTAPAGIRTAVRFRRCSAWGTGTTADGRWRRAGCAAGEPVQCQASRSTFCPGARSKLLVRHPRSSPRGSRWTPAVQLRSSHSSKVAKPHRRSSLDAHASDKVATSFIARCDRAVPATRRELHR